MENIENKDSQDLLAMHKVTDNKAQKSKGDSSSKIVIVMISVVAILILFNQFTIMSISSSLFSSGGSSGIIITKSGADITPKGIPRIYGAELGVSYDDISPADPSLADSTIAKIGSYDRSIAYGSMTDAQKKRYVDITSQIACEYCCGAESLIFSNGEAACGCAHSISMRGLAKYLVTKHGVEFTDDQVLEELGKWKTLYFPGILAGKADVLKKKGIELNYINLASNKYRGIENGETTKTSSDSGGAMVGGC